MKWLPPFIAGAIVALAAMLLYNTFSGKGANLVADLQKTNEQQKSEIERQRRELVAEHTAVQRLEAATPSPASTAASSAVAPPPATPPVQKPRGPFAHLTSMMKDPGMRDMIMAQQQKMIEANYSDLIADFHFTPEERAQFLKLLVAKQAINMDFGMKLMQVGTDPAQRTELTRQMKEAQAKSDTSIREFFNSDADYQRYTTYTEQQPQRMEVQALNPGLERIHQPLSGQQQSALIDAMQAETKSFHFSANSNSPTPDAETSNRMIQEQAALQQRIATKAAAILTPEQMTVFRQNQANFLQMMKTAGEMSRSMTGD